ncbi:MAG: Crp/Fnr family transcriptional regulator [Firmicutes bacterium HGW-Firmicutes-16]|nr:MAG: Crp/Fnr family transcriptional regulator [Firmicutes bacterium HGW-Firmicutes-16]
MEKHFEILKRCGLFAGIEETELKSLLSCLAAKTVRFDKNCIVFRCGEAISSFGIVLSGQVQIYQDDYFGNRSILGNVGPGGLFGESFAFAEINELPVSVITPTESELMFIDCGRLSSPCANACSFHSRLIRNLMNIIARKNVTLTQKIEFTSKRTTREKLLSYLSSEAQKAKSNSFSIPFSRQELADYLSVDRSAMSAELGRLKDDGVLDFRKNQFELL